MPLVVHGEILKRIAVLWLQKLINLSVAPTLLECLEQSELLNLAVPPLLMIIENSTAENYLAFIRQDFRKLFTTIVRPVQVRVISYLHD